MSSQPKEKGFDFFKSKVDGLLLPDLVTLIEILQRYLNRKIRSNPLLSLKYNSMLSSLTGLAIDPTISFIDNERTWKYTLTSIIFILSITDDYKMPSWAPYDCGYEPSNGLYGFNWNQLMEYYISIGVEDIAIEIVDRVFKNDKLTVKYAFECDSYFDMYSHLRRKEKEEEYIPIKCSKMESSSKSKKIKFSL